MNRRNWLQLARKLVDRFDLSYTVDSIERYVAKNNLAFFGSGVLTTTTYPNPFPIALAGFSGTVGKGIAYDPYGLQVRIDDAQGTFSVAAADTVSTRKDLLVVRYHAVGDTLIPSPQTPTSQVYLNLKDSYTLAVILGTPGSGYPNKGQYDVILSGVTTPANGQPTLDLSVREIATPLRAFFPTFKQEALSGQVDGTNTVFTLSAVPYNPASLLIRLDGLALPASNYTLSGQTVTFAQAPSPAQDVDAFYVVNSAGSVNPVSGLQETPIGVVDGANNTFSLSQEPVDQNSTQVFVNGLAVPISGWSLNQNPTNSQVIFNAGYVPQLGQDVYAFYLRNVVSASGMPSSSSGGGSGGGSGNFNCEYPQLSSNDISNGYVMLGQVPAKASAVMVDLIGAGAQAYQTDFTINGKQLVWSNALAQYLSAGDQFRVFYNY